MKFLKVFLVIVLILVAIIIVGGMFLPKTYTVSRSINVGATDTTVYQNVADFNHFLKWNPWYKMEPSAKITITGAPAQVGHTYAWKDGKKTGAGEMKITEATPYTSVKTAMKFLEPFENSTQVQFNFAKLGDSTKVIWSMNGENNIVARWICLFMDMDAMVGKDFEAGLKSLKQLSEKR
jgi:hypothetical protein